MPKVCETSVIGAPLSIACEAWAWRTQCGDVSGLPPARFTIAFRM